MLGNVAAQPDGTAPGCLIWAAKMQVAQDGIASSGFCISELPSSLPQDFADQICLALLWGKEQAMLYPSVLPRLFCITLLS